MHNRFFLIGSQHFGVQPIQESDPYTGNVPDEIIRDLILAAFKEHYQSPITILSYLCDAIKSVLQEQYYYSGPKSAGCNTADANQWAQYLEKIRISYNDCFSFSYPYTDKLGACALIHSSIAPSNMSAAELKIVFKNNKGLLFFENQLFYWDAQTQAIPLYEFSETDEEVILAYKNRFLEMTRDEIQALSKSQLNALRTDLGLDCLFGTLTDLNWPKIKYLLLNRLLHEEYLSESLHYSEKAMLQLLEEEPSSMEAFQYILADGYIPNLHYFSLFMELFEHLNSQNKALLVQQYIRTQTPDQKYFLFVKLGHILKDVSVFSTILEIYYYHHDFNPSTIEVTIKKLPKAEQLDAILFLHKITQHNALFLDVFEEFLRNYPERKIQSFLKKAMTNQALIIPVFSLLNCFEVNQKLEYLEFIHTYSSQLNPHQLTTIFLKPFVTIVLESTPPIQEILLSHINPQNYNLLMSLLQYETKNVTLINQVMKLIPTFHSFSLIAIFILQNNLNKNSILHYLALLNSDLFLSILKLLNERKDISKDNLYSLLMLNNWREQDTIYPIVASDDHEKQLNLLKIFKSFPQHLQQKALQRWIQQKKLLSKKMDFLSDLANLFDINMLIELLIAMDKTPAGHLGFIKYAFHILSFLESDQQTELSLFIYDSFAQSTQIPESHHYLIPFIEFLRGLTPSHQTQILIHTDPSQNNNLLMKMISFSDDKANLTHELLSMIATLDQKDISRILTTQNKRNKNNALHYVLQNKTTSLLTYIKLIQKLPEADIIQIINQPNLKDELVIEGFAASNDVSVVFEITNIISTFSANSRSIYFLIWIKTLLNFKSIENVAEILIQINDYHLIANLLFTQHSGPIITNLLLCSSLMPLTMTALESLLPANRELTLIMLDPKVWLAALLRYNRVDLALNLVTTSSIEEIPLDQKNTLLYKAIINNKSQCALKLVNLGADPNYSLTISSNKMLWLAIENNLIEVVESMLKKPLTSYTLHSAILLMLNSDKDSYYSSLRGILQKPTTTGLNNLPLDKNCNYALHLALLKNSPDDILVLLCQRGTDFTKLNKAGKSPLSIAIELKQWNKLKLMLEHSSIVFNKKQIKEINLCLTRSGSALTYPLNSSPVSHSFNLGLFKYFKPNRSSRTGFEAKLS